MAAQRSFLILGFSPWIFLCATRGPSAVRKSFFEFLTRPGGERPLESLGVIYPKFAEGRILLAEEYRAELNHILTGMLKERELKEWAAIAAKRT
jgi:hypothetical protein